MIVRLMALKNFGPPDYWPPIKTIGPPGVDYWSVKNGRNVREKRAERPRKSGGTSEADVQEDGSSIYRPQP